MGVEWCQVICKQTKHRCTSVLHISNISFILFLESCVFQLRLVLCAPFGKPVAKRHFRGRQKKETHAAYVHTIRRRTPPAIVDTVSQRSISLVQKLIATGESLIGERFSKRSFVQLTSVSEWETQTAFHHVNLPVLNQILDGTRCQFTGQITADLM